MQKIKLIHQFTAVFVSILIVATNASSDEIFSNKYILTKFSNTYILTKDDKENIKSSVRNGEWNGVYQIVSYMGISVPNIVINTNLSTAIRCVTRMASNIDVSKLMSDPSVCGHVFNTCFGIGNRPIKGNLQKCPPIVKKIIVRQCVAREWKGEKFSKYCRKDVNDCKKSIYSGRENCREYIKENVADIRASYWEKSKITIALCAKEAADRKFLNCPRYMRRLAKYTEFLCFDKNGNRRSKLCSSKNPHYNARQKVRNERQKVLDEEARSEALLGGVLAVSRDASLGAADAPLTLDGGTLQWLAGFDPGKSRAINLGTGGGTFNTGKFDAAINQSINGEGRLTKAGGGTLTLNGENTFKGGTSVLGGVLAVSRDANLGAVDAPITLDGGTLQWLAGFDPGKSRAINLGTGGGTFNTGKFDAAINQSINGEGRLTKAGGGTLTLNGENTFKGGTSVLGGVLAVSRDANLGAVDAPITLDGGTLQWLAGFDPGKSRAINLGTGGGTFNTGKFDAAINQSINGEGRLTKAGGGTLTLNGENTFKGGTSVLGGVLAVSRDANLGAVDAPITLDGGTLQWLAGFDPGKSRAINLGTGGGTFNTGKFDAAINQSINGEGRLTKAGGGTLTLNGENTFKGGTSVLGGVLAVSRDANLGAVDAPITLDGGTLQWLAGFDPGKSRAINLGTGGGTFNTGKFDAAINQSINGEGRLTKAGGGTLTLNGENTFKGGTSVLGGVLAVSRDANLGAVDAPITLDGGTLQWLAGFDPGKSRAINLGTGGGTFNTGKFDAAINQSINGEGRLTKAGGGTLTLNGENTFKGGTSVLGGVLAVSRDANLGAVDAPITLDGGTLQWLAGFDPGKSRAINLGTGGGTFNTGKFDAAINQSINGEGRLTKAGGGTLTLNGENTFKGGTSVLGGVLAVSRDANLGAVDAPITLDGGTLQWLAGFDPGKSRAINLGTGGGTFNTGKFDAAINQSINGEGRLTKAGGGTLTLNGENTFKGGTSVLGGVLAVSRDANLGAVDAPITLDGGTLQWLAGFDPGKSRAINLGTGGGTFNTGKFDAAINQSINGEGRLTKAGGGTLTLNGENTFKGGTSVLGGVLAVSRDANLGAVDAPITLDGGGLEFLQPLILPASRPISLNGKGGRFLTNGLESYPVVVSGQITGSGALYKYGGGKLFLKGQNQYTGGTHVAMGKLVGNSSSIRGNLHIENRGTVVFNQHRDGEVSGIVTGKGRIIKRGRATLNFTGDGSGFEGKMDIRRGAVVANGRWGGDIIVRRNSVFQGQVTTDGNLDIRSGGIHQPGNSIGTVQVDSYRLGGGNTAMFEIGEVGQSDRVEVSGTATIAPGATIAVDWYGQNGPLWRRYTIITADNIDGEFSGVIDNVNAPFVDLVASNDTRTINIEAKRNDVPFEQFALSANAKAAAEAIDMQRTQDKLYQSIALQHNAEDAQKALGMLPGVLHTSQKTAIIEDDMALRHVVSDRIRSAFASTAAKTAPVTGYGPQGARPAPATIDSLALWGNALGSWANYNGSSDGDLDARTSGLLFGADATVGDWRVGLLGGYGQSTYILDTSSSSHGRSRNYHAGLFGGTNVDKWTLQTGMTYSWHEISNRRTVAYPGVFNPLSADYSANVITLFTELGYEMKGQETALEPFVGLDYGLLNTNGFSEEGGIAAVNAGSQSTTVGLARLGLHASTDFSIGKSMARAYGTIAWRYAFGDTDPATSQAFANSESFNVRGVSIVKNSAFVEAGLEIDTGLTASLAIAYSGQIARAAQQHGAKALLQMSF